MVDGSGQKMGGQRSGRKHSTFNLQRGPSGTGATGRVARWDRRVACATRFLKAEDSDGGLILAIAPYCTSVAPLVLAVWM